MCVYQGLASCKRCPENKVHVKGTGWLLNNHTWHILLVRLGQQQCHRSHFPRLAYTGTAVGVWNPESLFPWTPQLGSARHKGLHTLTPGPALLAFDPIYSPGSPGKELRR